MEIRVLVLAIVTVVIRLFGNASVVILTGTDPRPVALRKRLIHWLVSLGAAVLVMVLAPLLVDM